MIVSLPGDHEVAVAQISNGRGRVAPIDPGRAAVHAPVAVHRLAAGVEFAQVDVAPVVTRVVVEGDHEAARGEAADLGLVLGAVGVFVHLERIAHRRAVQVVALGEGGVAGAVEPVVVFPDDDEAAIGEGCHVGVVLRAGGGGVDLEGVAKAARCAVGAPEDAPAAAVVAVAVAPHDDEIAVGVGGDARQVLAPRLCVTGARRDADPLLRGALHVAGVVVAGQVDVVAVAAGHVAIGRPGHRETVGVAGHDAVELGAFGGGVHHDRAARRRAVGVVALGEHAPAPAAAFVAAVVLPGDHVAAVREARDLRVALLAGRNRVDAELRAHRFARGGVALGVGAPGRGVLEVGVPRDHVAAVRQPADRRVALVAGREGVDRLFAVGRRRAVQLACHVDRDQPRRRGGAMTILDPYAHLTAGLRTERAVAIGDVLDQRLDRIGRRRRVERNGQVSAVAATGYRADIHTAIGNRAARHSDLAKSTALVADRQLILHTAATGEENRDHATIETGTVRSSEADEAIENLRGGIDEVFAEGHAAAEIGEGWRRRAYQLGGAAEELLVDPGRRSVLVIRTPGHDEVVTADMRHRRLVLVVGRTGCIDAHFATRGRAVRLVFAHVNVGVSAGRAPAFVIPADHKAAVGQGRNLRLILVAASALVDQKLAAKLHARCVEALGINAVGGTVVPAVVRPHNDKTAAGERNHMGVVLAGRGCGVDGKLAARLVAAGVEALAVHPGTAAILIIGAPDDDERAVGEGGHPGLVLVIGCRRVDRELAAQRAAVVAVTLGIDAGAAAVLVTGKPRGDKASVEGCERGMVLVVVGVGVDPELAALGKAGGVEALGIDTRAAAVAVLVGPGNGKAAVGQADNGRIGLVS